MKPKGHGQSASARFIFRGTVIGPVRGAASRGAAVVRVDEVLEAPSILLGYNGRDVIVVPPTGSALNVGDTRVIHGGGYEFGSGLTVEAARIERATATPRVAAPTLGWQPPAAAAARRMSERAQQASAVVAGVVESVRLPRTAAAATARTAAAAAAPARGPISEHDPHWREAVVKVTQTHKGQPGSGEVVVQFAASNDVRWFKAPKLQAGQTGVFSLHPPPEGEPPAPKRRAGALAAAKGPRLFFALDPADVQPLEREEEVARALSAPTEPAAARADGAKVRRRARAKGMRARRRRGGARTTKGGR